MISAAPWAASWAHAQDLRRIAIALPLSGPHAKLGHDLKVAIELVSTPDIAVTWHDDGCSSAGGAAAAKAIVAIEPAQRPHLVVGHACPSAADVAAPIYEAAKVPFLAAGRLPGRSALTPRRFGPLHFRIPAERDQGALLGETLADAGPTARIGFVRDRTQFAITTLQTAARTLTQRGRTVALTETFNGGDKDFSALAQRLKTAGITHIAIAAFSSEAMLLVPELRAALGDATIVGTDTLADPAFAKVAGVAADGVQVALAPDMTAFPAAQDFARKYEAATGTKPNWAALATAAAVQIAARLPASETTASLTTSSHETLLGPITFDALGHTLLSPHALYTWRGGALLPPSRP